MLISLGYPEVRSILAEQGEVEVGCQFCGMQYRFDAVDAEQLFAASLQPDVPTTRH
jgi:molecular chaperone Hsp33